MLAFPCSIQHGQTALLQAVRHKNQEMVRELVQANVDVNQMEQVCQLLHSYCYITLHCLHVCVLYTQGGLSALMMCCENGNSEMAKLLLDSEANPDLQQSVEYHKHSLYVIGNFPKTMGSRLL